ncbi:hypothetical protein P43SY_007496 [Pythium insidiosum]|uniref:C2 domain-containing protein n=1 Tax=Pythium insidiosum TaxID=114742 RepID=A0AAD5LA00_PYTIN|nr:hypothetical protein P43SY_007496 [Pythium insidiosum]
MSQPTGRKDALVTALTYSSDRFRLLELTPDVEKAIMEGESGARQVRTNPPGTSSLTEQRLSITCENEVREMLAELNAFEDGGSWHVLDPDYQASVFADILDAVVQNDWDFEMKGIAMPEILRACAEPEVVVRQCCRAYGRIDTSADGQEVCRLDKDKIALFCARQLFREHSETKQAAQPGATPGWPLDQFMEKWQLRVPEPIKVTPEMLRGVALTKTQRGKPTWLHYFPEDQLPMDPKLRFEKLFQQQEKWTVEQLEPYIRMPCTIKIRVVEARDLPVMDRASKLTDAFVSITFASFEAKSSVSRKTLNPKWDEEFRFDVADDSVLQSQPIEFRVMDHDVYTSDATIGIVYVDLNCLLMRDGHVIQGWFPVYDTLLGVRCELSLVVRLLYFGDVNPFRESSAGVQFFGLSTLDPSLYTVEKMLGFVEELVVHADPEYSWSDNFRTRFNSSP